MAQYKLPPGFGISYTAAGMGMVLRVRDDCEQTLGDLRDTLIRLIRASGGRVDVAEEATVETADGPVEMPLETRLVDFPDLLNMKTFTEITFATEPREPIEFEECPVCLEMPPADSFAFTRCCRKTLCAECAANVVNSNIQGCVYCRDPRPFGLTRQRVVLEYTGRTWQAFPRPQEPALHQYKGEIVARCGDVLYIRFDQLVVLGTLVGNGPTMPWRYYAVFGNRVFCSWNTTVNVLNVAAVHGQDILGRVYRGLRCEEQEETEDGVARIVLTRQ